MSTTDHPSNVEPFHFQAFLPIGGPMLNPMQFRCMFCAGKDVKDGKDKVADKGPGRIRTYCSRFCLKKRKDPGWILLKLNLYQVTSGDIPHFLWRLYLSGKTVCFALSLFVGNPECTLQEWNNSPMELIKAIDHHNPSDPKTKQVIFCPTSQPSHSVLGSRFAFWNSGGESPTIPEVAGEFFDQLRLLSTQ